MNPEPDLRPPVTGGFAGIARKVVILLFMALITHGAGSGATGVAYGLDATTRLQQNLVGLGYLPPGGVDGKLGSQTRSAVRSFQHDNGMAEDGNYGPQSELALHNKVKEVQRKAGTGADGNFGPVTKSAVSTWQRAHQLTADGIAGAITMKAMGIARTVWIIAQQRFAAHGWSGSAQSTCLNELWMHESNWKVYADNPSSSAYGIPQSLPGSKMAAAGSDWRTNPATQIEWGEDYIKSRYQTPCKAWEFWQDHHWY